VDQHIEDLGRRSVQILLHQLAGVDDFSPVHEVLPTQLLLRHSTLEKTSSPRVGKRPAAAPC
jgi:DNA-binding LacI/PurR family transcriptional regulator